MDDRTAGLIDLARVATLAIVSVNGSRHLVPVVFARDGGDLVTAIDGKSKRGTRLARIDNIDRDPRVTLLMHNYEEDWSRLWWVRIDGNASILRQGERFSRALTALRERYAQYRSVDLSGPVIVVGVERIATWEADPS